MKENFLEKRYNIFSRWGMLMLIISVKVIMDIMEYEKQIYKFVSGETITPEKPALSKLNGMILNAEEGPPETKTRTVNS